MTPGSPSPRRLWKAVLFGLAIAAIIGGFLLQMAHGICPVP